MRNPPNRQISAASHTLTGAAQGISDALCHLDQELHAIDGWPASTMGDGRRSETQDTVVERAALSRLQLIDQRHQILADMGAVVLAIDALTLSIRRGLGMRAPAKVSQTVLCRDRQTGRDGVIDWGNDTCTELPIKAGLCSACYQRERRWRIGHNLAPRDTEPVG